jgi:hypothetical protein
VPAENLAFIRAAVVTINNLVKAEAAKYANWSFVDPEGSISVSGAFVSGISTDGTHLSLRGAQVLADMEAAAFDGFFASGAIPEVSTVYEGRATWAASSGQSPSDTPYVGGTAVTVNTQRCNGMQWEMDVTVTAGTNNLDVLWTAIKTLSTATAGQKLLALHDVVVKDSSGDLVEFQAHCRAYIYGTSWSHLNEIRFHHTKHAQLCQPFTIPINYADMAANTRVGFALKLPVGTYTVIVKPMRLVEYSPGELLP